ncbi:TIGR03899 family protein [Ferrimonas aestuarii]|uniref:TIGR03899 family protein n=1 Tax=Ferrimonas aestuarii TaxID=2569539 RepID=A0A4U1BRF2_9GAMM|nr:TIGR03899 family protein [Ferrimonas aestuarii]TKB56738.1 TIGR03899 family protein [Ferrimonas aestuarii]
MSDTIVAPPANASAGKKTARQQAVSIARRMGLTGNDNNSSNAVAHRADQRLKNLEDQKQLNIEAILKMAINLAGNAVNKELDADWQFQFCQMAEQIHNSSMQQLWAQILATEISMPGSFSLRALETLKSMTQREAILFSRAVATSVQLNQEPSRKLLTGVRREAGLGGFSAAKQESINLSGLGLPYSNILLLKDLGLIYGTELETGRLPKAKMLLKCQDQNLPFTPKNNRLRLRYYRFTQVGDELSRLITEPANQEACKAISSTLATHFFQG